MDSRTQSAGAAAQPAQRVDAAGRTHVDQRAVLGVGIALAVGTQLLWLAAGYQFFNGLNLGSVCLRGAGDVRVPAALSRYSSMSWCSARRCSCAGAQAPGRRSASDCGLPSCS